MGDKKKILAIIATIILVGGLAAGWIMWRRDVTANKQDEQTQQTEQPKKEQSQDSTDDNKTDTETKPSATPGETDDKAVQMAVQFETAARNWGTDPTVNPSTYAKQDAQTVVDALRTPALGDNPIASLISFKLSKESGPSAMSIPCQKGYQASCSQQMTMGSWWTHEALGTGTRWIKGPTAKVDGNAIRITGTVKSILVQDTDTYGAGDYSAITPAWKTYEINDLVTIHDGKVASVKHEKSDPWWIDPWIRDWDDTMASSLTTATRYAIPVKGVPNMGLAHYGETPLLGAPKTGADTGVDWSAWGDLDVPAGGGSAGQPASQCQNPLPDGSCPSSF